MIPCMIALVCIAMFLKPDKKKSALPRHSLFSTITVWDGFRPKTLWKVKYRGKEVRKFCGIRYTKKVTKIRWVDEKTKFRPIQPWESRFFR